MTPEERYQKWYAVHGKEANQNRVNFKNKLIRLKVKPRRGVCEKCGVSVKRGDVRHTTIHHTKYDPANPLANTIELCMSCHTKEGWKLGQYAERVKRQREHIDERSQNLASKRIIALLKSNNDRAYSQVDLAEGLKVTKRTINLEVGKLMKTGMIYCVGTVGHRKLYRLT